MAVPELGVEFVGVGVGVGVNVGEVVGVDVLLN